MTKNCYILVSDFTGFFDNIDHKKLKENIRKVIGVNKLPDDVYKVYKSMTRYSYINKDDIVQYLKSVGIEDEKSIDKLNSLFDNISFSKFKKENKNIIHLNKNDYGIPQGSPLSGIYANVYMIDFDQKINEYVKEKAGMYMRYSDDTIIIIPTENINDINQLWNDIFKIKEMYPTLDMNVSKISGYIYQNQEIISLHNQIEGMQKSINILNFLGFSFDGKFVRFRDKSLFKFYYKYYRKIDGMVFRESRRVKKGKKKHSKLDKHRILKELNSSNGSNKKFIDYVNRAKRVFKNEKYIVNFRKKFKEKTFIRFEKEKLRLQAKNK